MAIRPFSDKSNKSPRKNFDTYAWLTAKNNQRYNCRKEKTKKNTYKPFVQFVIV